MSLKVKIGIIALVLLGVITLIALHEAKSVYEANHLQEHNCIACLIDKGKQWCSQSGERQCQNLAAGSSASDCTMNPGFCGVQWCEELDVVPGLNLVPYALVCAFIVEGIFINLMLALFTSKYSPLRQKMQSYASTQLGLLAIEENAEPGYTRNLGKERAILLAQCFAGVNPYLHLFNLGLCLINFMMLCRKAFFSEDFQGLSGWWRYDAVIVSWMNGSTAQVLGASIPGAYLQLLVRKAVKARQRGQGYWDDDPAVQTMLLSTFLPFVNVGITFGQVEPNVMHGRQLPPSFWFWALFPFTLLLPPFLTHILPMWFAYIWIILPLFLLTAYMAAGFIVEADEGEGEWARSDCWYILVMCVMRFSLSAVGVTLLLQMPCMWAHGLYGGEGYIGALVKDVVSRKIACYISRRVNGSIYSFFSFLTWATL